MAKEVDYSAKATVTITLQVKSEGHWGKGATIEEVMRIGGRETITAIHDALREGGLKYSVVGEPVVGAITWEVKSG